MNLSGPMPKLEYAQRVHLQRFAASELLAYIASAVQDPEMECRNANLWLKAAGAKPLRSQEFSKNLARPQQGTLWKLWCGELFWTSRCGRYFAAEIMEH